jgi:hypothetical protein
MPQRRLILFELNEVPIRVVEHYAAKHLRSAFAKILTRGRRFDTYTRDEGHLSPWITWPTLHRGVSNEQHQITALGQDVSDVDAKYPPIWQLLTAAGKRVGMFGSLHSYPLPDDVDRYAFYVPDTFAAGSETMPEELSAFQNFNLHMVDRSGRNVSSELPVKEAVGFLFRSLPAGLRGSTLAKIARQLATERVWKHRTSRRRTVQSLIAFDLFLAQLESKRPDAAFFFTNHVASSLHRYWPATFLDDYKATQWSESWVGRFSGEIDYTMTEADQMLGELMDFAERNPDYLVLVAGSMGQAAVDDPKWQINTEVLLCDLDKFMALLGVKSSWKRRRTMQPTYTLHFANECGADEFFEAISKVKVAGEPLQARHLGPCGVEFVLGHTNLRDDELTVTIGNRGVEPADAGIANVPIEEKVGAAAYHVREGMLLVFDPNRVGKRQAPEPVSTTRIAPTLLALSGVEPPSYMEAPIDELFGKQLEAA